MDVQLAMTTCAVIPAFNEGLTVANVVKETARFVNEVLVIDDHSTDGTGSVAAAAGARVFENEFEKGAHLATLYGVRKSEGYGVVVTLDADGQHPPQAIPELLAPLLSDRADFVIGRRNRLPPSERTVRMAASSIMRSKNEIDVGTGYRAFRTSLLKGMKPSDVGLCGCGSFVLYAWRKGDARIAEVEFGVLPRKVGVSKFSNVQKYRLHEQQADFLLNKYGGD